MPSVVPAFSLPSQLLVRPHYRTSRCPRRPAQLRRRSLCVAQQEQIHPPPPQVPSNDGGPSSGAPPSETDDSERKEQARKARMEAERLELMAAKARLEFERAELNAERKRLELDKVRTMKDSPTARDTRAATTTNPYAENYNSTDTSTSSNTNNTSSKNSLDGKLTATVKIGSGPPKKVTADSLSDLLSSEFPRVSEADIAVIKDKLCGMDTFFVTDVDRSPFDERVVFRGNMRMDATELLDEIERRAEQEGLLERVRLFILVDPKESPNDGDGERRPVLVALPAAAMPPQTSPFSLVFSTAVGLIALFTSFSYGIGTFGLTPDVISQIAKGSTDDALLTLPVSVGIMALSLIHDAGHRVMGNLRNVKLGLPFFIPSLQIGNFGIITPLESYARFRKDLFDVAVAGPIAGIAASLFAVVYGLVATSAGEPLAWFPQVPSGLFHVSLLIGSFADFILPATMRAQATVPVHPLFLVGFTGLLINALNLMPIGRLDGGRIIQALYGRIVAGRATAITLILQGVSSIAGNSPLLLFWGLVCVFLQRESDFPCLNEVQEPDNTRSALGLGMLILALTILIPFPDQVGNILGTL